MGFETDWVLHRFVVRSAPSRLLAKEWGIDHGFLNYARASGVEGFQRATFNKKQRTLDVKVYRSEQLARLFEPRYWGFRGARVLRF